jgi:HECT-like Ubiquitin-conjugating enzyme (E2)-binding
MGRGDIAFYAEYMSKIRSITLAIGVEDSLITADLKFLNSSNVLLTYVLVNEPSKALEKTILLPASVTPNVENKTYTVTEPQKMISFRFPSLGNSIQYESRGDSPIPWSASEMKWESTSFSLGCVCGTKLINSTKISHWKALPSENWAEMMDFWHCHKPDTGTSEYNKSYAASRFVPYDGCIFVGLNYFYVFPENCENIIINTDQVQCRFCSKVLGISEDPRTIKLWKWNLTIEEPRNLLRSSYPGYIYASSTILQQIEAHATYVYNIKCDERNNEERQHLVSL